MFNYSYKILCILFDCMQKASVSIIESVVITPYRVIHNDNYHVSLLVCTHCFYFICVAIIKNYFTVLFGLRELIIINHLQLYYIAIVYTRVQLCFRRAKKSITNLAYIIH